MLKSEDLVQLVDYSRNDTVPELVRAAEEERAAVVERLRAEVAAERAAERAAVVAFLRETLATSETAYASDDLDYAIDIIERGDHRREETK